MGKTKASGETKATKGGKTEAAAPAASASASTASGAKPYEKSEKGKKPETSTTSKEGETKVFKNKIPKAGLIQKDDPRFVSRPRSFRIGGAIQPKRNLGRFVKWPRYVRIQRQRKILYERLKVPPAINQFLSAKLEKNQSEELFKLLELYKPETKKQKQERLKEIAKAKIASDSKEGTKESSKEGTKEGSKETSKDESTKDKKEKSKSKSKKPVLSESTKPNPTIKMGLHHVTYLIEQKTAKLVVLAADTNPIELIVWMPALCRKFDIPYIIVRSKARLGSLVHKKTASCIALPNVNKEDIPKLNQIIELAKALFNNNVESRRTWGGGQVGLRTKRRIAKREELVAIEKAKKSKLAA